MVLGGLDRDGVAAAAIALRAETDLDRLADFDVLALDALERHRPEREPTGVEVLDGPDSGGAQEAAI